MCIIILCVLLFVSLDFAEFSSFDWSDDDRLPVHRPGRRRRVGRLVHRPRRAAALLSSGLLLLDAGVRLASVPPIRGRSLLSAAALSSQGRSLRLGPAVFAHHRAAGHQPVKELPLLRAGIRILLPERTWTDFGSHPACRQCRHCKFKCE